MLALYIPRPKPEISHFSQKLFPQMQNGFRNHNLVPGILATEILLIFGFQWTALDNMYIPLNHGFVLIVQIQI